MQDTKMQDARYTMETPILAMMSDAEIDEYIGSISYENISDVSLQIRLYCEYVQRNARKRNDLSPDARIMIENLAKLSKAMADIELISSLDMPSA